MKKILPMVLAMSLVSSMLVFTAYGNGTPGSEGDPLVSQSYVDDQIDDLLDSLGDVEISGSVDTDEIVSKVMEQLELTYDLSNSQNDVDRDTDGNPIITDDASAATYSPVNITAGEIIYGGEGTEMILRSGTASTYIVGIDGIVNITTGENLASGLDVPANNMLIVPRDDGRGLQCTSDEAWLLVKGEYTIN